MSQALWIVVDHTGHPLILENKKHFEKPYLIIFEDEKAAGAYKGARNEINGSDCYYIVALALEHLLCIIGDRLLLVRYTEERYHIISQKKH